MSVPGKDQQQNHHQQPTIHVKEKRTIKPPTKPGTIIILIININIIIIVVAFDSCVGYRVSIIIDGDSYSGIITGIKKVTKMVFVKFDDDDGDDDEEEIPYTSKDLIWINNDTTNTTNSTTNTNSAPVSREISPIKTKNTNTTSSSKKKPILIKWDDKDSKVLSSSLSSLPSSSSSS
jgi:hypothetical protein